MVKFCWGVIYSMPFPSHGGGIILPAGSAQLQFCFVIFHSYSILQNLMEIRRNHLSYLFLKPAFKIGRIWVPSQWIPVAIGVWMSSWQCVECGCGEHNWNMVRQAGPSLTDEQPIESSVILRSTKPRVSFLQAPCEHIFTWTSHTMKAKGCKAVALSSIEQSKSLYLAGQSQFRVASSTQQAKYRPLKSNWHMLICSRTAHNVILCRRLCVNVRPKKFKFHTEYLNTAICFWVIFITLWFGQRWRFSFRTSESKCFLVLQSLCGSSFGEAVGGLVWGSKRQHSSYTSFLELASDLRSVRCFSAKENFSLRPAWQW